VGGKGKSAVWVCGRVGEAALSVWHWPMLMCRHIAVCLLPPPIEDLPLSYWFLLFLITPALILLLLLLLLLFDLPSSCYCEFAPPF